MMYMYCTCERTLPSLGTDCCAKNGNVVLQPETVAAYLVPRVRTVVARKALSTYIKYLTVPRALMKFMSAPTKANKYFNKQGMVLCSNAYKPCTSVQKREMTTTHRLHCAMHQTDAMLSSRQGNLQTWHALRQTALVHDVVTANMQ